MRVLRTPDDRFDSLPDFPFEAHYVDVPDGEGGVLRVHHLDEGPADGPVVLLLHGEPTWSYLYRHMVPVLADAGLRCVVPDLVGFGRSDKPTQTSDYTYARHVEWMSALVFDALDLRDITLFAQDWGGLVGLRLLAQDPDRFARVVVSNTGFPSGDGKVSEAFLTWQTYSREAPTLAIGRLVAGGCVRTLSPEVIAAYDAPFPDDSYKAGARIFPSLMPMTPDDPATPANRQAWDVLERFDKPFLCAFSDSDPITRGGDAVFVRRVVGAAGQPHRTIEAAGHFVQEDKGPELAELIIEMTAPGHSSRG
jgi:haloalkane dehalogenase